MVAVVVAVACVLALVGSPLPDADAEVPADPVVVPGVRTAPTVSVVPGVGSLTASWDPVPLASKYRYRIRMGSESWSTITQTRGTGPIVFDGLAPGTYTVAIGSRVRNKWRNEWTEVTVAPLSPVTTTTTAPPTSTTATTLPGGTGLGFADYVDALGLGVDSADGLGHTFGKPCVADLDADGHLDVVWSNHYDGPWDVYFGLANGTFAEDHATDWSEGDLLTDRSPTDPDLPHKDNHGCAVGDFDLDGRLDLYEAVGACIGACEKTEGLWLQQDDGTFVNGGSTRLDPTATMDRSRYPVTLDADLDGDDDVFISAVNTGSARSTNRYLRNDDGYLREVGVGVANGQRQVNCTIAADVDADGDTDLIVCRQFVLHLFRNRGDGTFARVSGGIPKTTVARSVAVTDLDADGSPDVLVLTDTELQVRLGRSGRFPRIDHRIPVAAGRDLALPDLDGDGREDVFVVQQASGLAPSDPGADFALLNESDGSGIALRRVDVPQAATGLGDSAQVLPDFWGSGRDAVLVSNGWFGNVGARQVIAASGLTPPDVEMPAARLELRSEPAGVPLRLDDTPVTGPVDVTAGAEYTIAAPESVTIDGQSWVLDAWTAGGHATHRWIAAPGDTVLVATYECVSCE